MTPAYGIKWSVARFQNAAPAANNHCGEARKNTTARPSIMKAFESSDRSKSLLICGVTPSCQFHGPAMYDDNWKSETSCVPSGGKVIPLGPVHQWPLNAVVQA